MKVIAENKISTVLANSENANFPDDNLLDIHPKKVWKADATNTAVITFEIDAGTSGLALFNTNARFADVEITDANYVEWFDGTTWFNGTEWVSTEVVCDSEISQNGSSYALWVDYDYINSALNAVLTLTALPGQTLEAGVGFSGLAIDFKNPKYEIKQGLIDYSIFATYSNGAEYYEKKDTVRTFSVQIIEDRENDFYTFMNNIGRDVGLSPIAWRLTDLDSFEWVVFARFNELPEGNHILPNDSSIDFSLIEVL